MKSITLILVTMASTTTGQPLPTMNIDPDHITIAGYSSGSFMASTADVIHSDVFKGAGLLSGGVYGVGGVGPGSSFWDHQWVKLDVK